jgi:pimeloyl-ACP methyl ester carboxylesterase
MLVLTLLWTGLLTWVLASIATAWVLLRPVRMTPGRAMARFGRMSPSDMGLRYEQERFEVLDSSSRRRLAMSGWWIVARETSDRTVVLVHGYADAKVGALLWAQPLLDLGFNVLLTDLRAHGESEGQFTTAGLRDRHDLDQIINQIRAARPAETEHVVLMGISMGAAVVLAAAELRDDLSGVIVDSPVADFYHGAATQLWLMGLPGRSVLFPGLWLAEMLIGQRFSSIRPQALIEKLHCPILALLPGDDPFLPDGEGLRSAIRGKSNIDGISEWVDFPQVGHLLALQQDPAKYVDALKRFAAACKSDRLARASGPLSPSSSSPVGSTVACPSCISSATTSTPASSSGDANTSRSDE